MHFEINYAALILNVLPSIQNIQLIFDCKYDPRIEQERENVPGIINTRDIRIANLNRVKSNKNTRVFLLSVYFYFAVFLLDCVIAYGTTDETGNIEQTSRSQVRPYTDTNITVRHAIYYYGPTSVCRTRGNRKLNIFTVSW